MCLAKMTLLAIEDSLNFVIQVCHMNLSDLSVRLEEFESMIRPNPEV